MREVVTGGDDGGESVTCNIRGPFDSELSPVIGEYNITGKTEKIIDKAKIDEIWNDK